MERPTPPILIDVIAPLPEGWGICVSCEMMLARANLDTAPTERGLDEYPPDWQADFHRLSDVVIELSALYGDRVLIRLWNPRSLQGMWKSLRHGVRRYPTFLVKGRKISGLDSVQLERALAEALSA
jgi:hypothetical protein